MSPSLTILWVELTPSHMPGKCSITDWFPQPEVLSFKSLLVKELVVLHIALLPYKSFIYLKRNVLECPKKAYQGVLCSWLWRRWKSLFCVGGQSYSRCWLRMLFTAELHQKHPSLQRVGVHTPVHAFVGCWPWASFVLGKLSTTVRPSQSQTAVFWSYWRVISKFWKNCLVYFWDRVHLCSPGWSHTHDLLTCWH